MRQALRILVSVLSLAVFAPQTTGAEIAPDESTSMTTIGSRRVEHPIRELAIAPDELGDNWVVIPESVEELRIDELGRAPRHARARNRRPRDLATSF